MKIFYFTATGNSLYVAKKVGGELYSIPQMIKEGKWEFEKETKDNPGYSLVILNFEGDDKKGTKKGARMYSAQKRKSDQQVLICCAGTNSENLFSKFK